MTTSGTSVFEQTRDQLILDAFQLIGVYGLGRTVSAADSLVARNALNKMLKAWQTQGLHLWTKTEAVLYFTQYVNKYTLGSASTYAYCTNKSDEIKTKLASSVAIAATNLTVVSTTGMTVNDYIGLVQSDGSLHWTTIATIPTSTTLTITTGPTYACSADAYVFTFTNRINKPLRINDARIVSGYDSGSSSTESQVVMTLIPYQDYHQLPDNTTLGVPIQATYMPSRLNGVLEVWPRPSDCSQRVEFTYERIIEDMNSAADDFDFPAEWLEAITFNLAMRLGPSFGKDQKIMQTIGPMAQQFLEDLKNWDSEITSVSITPDLGY